jgi:hypothetical protein
VKLKGLMHAQTLKLQSTTPKRREKQKETLDNIKIINICNTQLAAYKEKERDARLELISQ